MDAVVEYERLDLPEAATAAIASFLSTLVTLVLVAASLNSDDSAPFWPDLDGLLVVLVIYAGPVWLVGFLVVGIPAAVWIERRTRMDASWGRRFAPYAVAGLVAGGLLFLLHPLFLPAAVAAALGGKAGVELWRRWDARHERAAGRPAVSR